MKTRIFTITRHAAPTQLDTADRGTLCQVSGLSEKSHSFYVQMSSNAEKPFWVELEATNLHDAEIETTLIVNGG